MLIKFDLTIDFGRISRVECGQVKALKILIAFTMLLHQYLHINSTIIRRRLIVILLQTIRLESTYYTYVYFDTITRTSIICFVF